jgi:hypothetical protein
VLPAAAPCLPLVPVEVGTAVPSSSGMEAPVDPGPPAAGFVVSLTKTDWRRLHRFGGCSRMPGVHYLRFELLGLGRPRVDQYDDFCRGCWPEAGPDEEFSDDELESETENEEEGLPLLGEDPA